ncbi:hypothetical protein [Eubacterium sp. AB3007]|uniref:hypothetical protein n=1 Tax=Eubacterium sp. AB3007 TaxID=1392487 RepID=UPI000483B5F6|nr:hypothetical protein [Eubacterium sp. AB3007]
MDTIQRKTERKIARLRESKALCEKQLQQLPKGKLLVTEKKGRPYYSLFLDRHSYYLRTEDARIQLLQDRHLVEETLQGVTRQLTLLEKGSREIVPFDPNELLRSFPPAYQHPSTEIFRAIGFVDARTWATQPYNRNTRHPESLRVRTKQGLMVRSRIESSICEIYEDAGIPFRYEETLKLPNGVELNPDYHPLIPGVLLPKRHEHCGMMDDPGYVEREFLWKRDQYLRAGLIPGRDVLFTFDGPGGQVDLPQLRKEILDWIDFCRHE